MTEGELKKRIYDLFTDCQGTLGFYFDIEKILDEARKNFPTRQMVKKKHRNWLESFITAELNRLRDDWFLKYFGDKK